MDPTRGTEKSIVWLSKAREEGGVGVSTSSLRAKWFVDRLFLLVGSEDETSSSSYRTLVSFNEWLETYKRSNDVVVEP